MLAEVFYPLLGARIWNLAETSFAEIENKSCKTVTVNYGKKVGFFLSLLPPRPQALGSTASCISHWFREDTAFWRTAPN